MPSETELRDQLAVERTRLANERTLLAYVRTALACAAGGVGLLEFVGTPLAARVAPLLIAWGGLTLAFGTLRFFQVRARLNASGA